LKIFFIIDNDYIPILPTKLSTTYLTYIVYAEKIKVGLIWKHLGIYFIPPILFYFWFSSLILLVAMIGAIVLTMHKTIQVKRLDVF
jgi:NADH-ubiquinone oxidoreductase chain 6